MLDTDSLIVVAFTHSRFSGFQRRLSDFQYYNISSSLQCFTLAQSILEITQRMSQEMHSVKSFAMSFMAYLFSDSKFSETFRKYESNCLVRRFMICRGCRHAIFFVVLDTTVQSIALMTMYAYFGLNLVLSHHQIEC